MQRTLSAWVVVVGALAVWTVVTVTTMDARMVQVPAPAAPVPLMSPAGGGAPVPVAVQEPANGLVGDEMCLMCHEAQGAIADTPHGQPERFRTMPMASGCESCHGPGQAHVEQGGADTIRRFGASKTDPRAENEACLTCHTSGAHVLWDGSAHDARNLACSSCHSVHTPKSVTHLLTTAAQTDLCASCHRPQAVKMRRAAHMPVRQGQMECSSCHNVHGATNVKLLRVGNWINESCVSCHAEKRGPFLFEHAAGRESCVSCHDPHGSSHDRMLVARMPMLCQRCHIGTRHPSTIYDQRSVDSRSNRIIGRSCVNCHSNIHGTNHPSGQTFLR